MVPSLIENLNVWSFPGGMKDDRDENLIRTALRETQEEIGLAENAVDIWGQLPPLPGRVTIFY